MWTADEAGGKQFWKVSLAQAQGAYRWVTIVTMCSCQRDKEVTQSHNLLYGIFLCPCKLILYAEESISVQHIWFSNLIATAALQRLGWDFSAKEEHMEESVSEMK